MGKTAGIPLGFDNCFVVFDLFQVFEFEKEKLGPLNPRGNAFMAPLLHVSRNIRVPRTVQVVSFVNNVTIGMDEFVSLVEMFQDLKMWTGMILELHQKL